MPGAASLFLKRRRCWCRQPARAVELEGDVEADGGDIAVETCVAAHRRRTRRMLGVLHWFYGRGGSLLESTRCSVMFWLF